MRDLKFEGTRVLLLAVKMGAERHGGGVDMGRQPSKAKTQPCWQLRELRNSFSPDAAQSLAWEPQG